MTLTVVQVFQEPTYASDGGVSRLRNAGTHIGMVPPKDASHRRPRLPSSHMQSHVLLLLMNAGSAAAVGRLARARRQKDCPPSSCFNRHVARVICEGQRETRSALC